MQAAPPAHLPPDGSLRVQAGRALTRARPQERRAGGAVDVLVLDAQHRQSLACMRRFGRQGLAVGAVACESEAWAPSFSSRWCSLTALVPDFDTHPHAYVDSLLSLLDRHPARMVLPAHDGSIEAIRARRAEIEHRAALPLASEAALAIAVSKERTLRLAGELDIATPRGILVESADDLCPAIEEVGLPLVVKPTRSWVEDGQGHGLRLQSSAAVSIKEAHRLGERALAFGGRALLQEWLPGRREAVSLFRARETFWASFVQLSYREWPLLGGASVLYESMAPVMELTSPAERLVREMGLDGCSVVEFRRDRHGTPVLMEVNPRMAGSVALALACGVDFPGLTRAWALGDALWDTRQYRAGRRMRWLTGDVFSLKSALAHPNQPDAMRRREAVGRFFLDFVVRAGALDPFDWKDIRPAVSEVRGLMSREARWQAAKVGRRLRRAGGL